MVMTGKQRAEYLKRIPWVTYVAVAVQCDSIRSVACKIPAHWRFRSLKKSIVRDGQYCMTHLIYRCFHGDLREIERLRRWEKRVVPEQELP